MAQVSNQTQLLEALNAQDSNIQITTNFAITSQINILYPVTIESLTASTPFMLIKDISYFTYLFRIQNGGSLTLQNIILDGDKDNHPIDNQNNRSLIYITGGTLNLLEGSVIQNNNAYLEGGGIYFNRNESYPNILTMNGNARITNCYSRTSGGGIMFAVGNAQDSFHIGEASQIDNNQAANGAGIYCRSYNQATSSILSIGDQVQITNNQASNTGGGICFSGFRDGSNAASILTLSGNVLLSGNQATHGAGIYFYASNIGDHLAITEHASIRQNTASQNGGGCNIQATSSPVDVSVNNASITDNIAGTGGGMYLLTNAGATVNFSGSIFTGNKATNGASGTGGGIWIKNQSQDLGVSAMLTNIILEQNQASAHAGGMALYSGAGMLLFQMTGGIVSNNLASQEGGGFVISNDGTGILTFNQSVFSKNTANGSGGGIYYANIGEGIASTITMTDVVVSNNTAGKSGGGLNLSSGTGTLTTLLKDCTIRSNTAQSNSGGGIWNGGNNDKLTLNGSTIVTGNITQSGNGGGIYFNSDNGSVLLTDNVKILENKADEVSTDFGNHGGGICLVPGILTIQENVEISSNQARKYGGGISAAEGSQIIMQSGTIQNNTSDLFGGGIWNHDNSTTILTGGNIADNKATFGNDIYSDSNLYMEGTRELIQGVYIANSSSIIKLMNALTETSTIQLESSLYVMPNASGTPIVIGEATATYPQLTQADADAFLKPPQGFEEWTVQLNGDNTQVLLAPINYHIQYENLMGAMNPNPTSYTTTTPTIELLPPHTILGYRFLGWFDSISGGNRVTSIPQGSSGTITLYARWEEINEYYTITFCGNDNCCPKAYHIPAQIIIQGEQEITLPTTIPQRNNYCFHIWSTDCCGRGTSYLPGETITSVNTDLYLYAIWKQNQCCCLCPPPQTASFTALKLEQGTNNSLSGAEFILSSGGEIVMSSTSDSFGRVSFTRLKPGKYVLQETVAPEGYEATTTTHQVIVDIDGNVTINGFPADGYLLYNTSQTRSERPVIISVTEGDTSITGTGIPDASITVTLPNGTQLQTTVDINGMWAVTIPSDITLQVGQTIYANQTESGKTSSENASFVVQAYA